MTYTKPEVNLLGNANLLIEGDPKGGGSIDSPFPDGAVSSAYDLDE